jgi:hypothetical protein
MTERPEDAPDDSQAGGPDPAEPTDAEPTADHNGAAAAAADTDAFGAPSAGDEAPDQLAADETDLAPADEVADADEPRAPAPLPAARDAGRAGRAGRRGAPAPTPAAPTPSELAVHVGDRASAVYVLVAVGAFVAIMLYGLVLGSGGLVTPVPTPTPRPSVSASPSASVTPSASVSAAPSSPAASQSPSAAPSASTSAPSASP